VSAPSLPFPSNSRSEGSFVLPSMSTGLCLLLIVHEALSMMLDT
ncbi:unnamed protein product, partial [Ectocarpus sp. 8 AP-2014]